MGVTATDKVLLFARLFCLGEFQGHFVFSPTGPLETGSDECTLQVMVIEEKACHEITTRILLTSFPCTLPSFISASLNCSPIAVDLWAAGFLPRVLSPREGEDWSSSGVMNWGQLFTQQPLSGKCAVVLIPSGYHL